MFDKLIFMHPVVGFRACANQAYAKADAKADELDELDEQDHAKADAAEQLLVHAKPEQLHAYARAIEVHACAKADELLAKAEELHANVKAEELYADAEELLVKPEVRASSYARGRAPPDDLTSTLAKTIFEDAGFPKVRVLRRTNAARIAAIAKHVRPRNSRKKNSRLDVLFEKYACVILEATQKSIVMAIDFGLSKDACCREVEIEF